MSQPRKLHNFPGGVHPAGHKAESNASPIRPMPLLPRYVVPLRQHIGTPARPLVQVGDRVLKGQMIGAAEGYVSTAVHAPTSGKVTAIEPRAVPHPSGLFDEAIVIEADGEDRSIGMQPLDWRTLDPSALRNRIREMGLAGLGGAVFPSYIKLNPGASRNGASPIHTLILNGAECEPWITCDDRLMRERATQMLEGARIMGHMLGARTVIVGVEDNKPEAIAALTKALSEAEADDIEIVTVPTCYPGGGGKQLAYTLTGVEVPTGGLSTDVGIQVFNVGTAFSLYQAVMHGEPLISRVVTVTGHVGTPGNFEARVGTPISDLLAAAGGSLEGASGEIIGGPMMGFDLMDLAAPVTKAVNCVLVKSPALFPPKPEALPCIRCGACARACPVELQPFEMYWFSRARDFGKAQGYNLFDCIECGCCSHVCPSHIPLVQYYRFAKNESWDLEREKKSAELARQRHEAKLARIARLEAEKKERAQKKRAALARSSAAKRGVGTEADPKKAAIEAALKRAAEKKAQLASAGIKPQNTEHLSDAQQRQIRAADARRVSPAETPTGEAPEQER